MMEHEACCTVAVPMLVTLWHLHQRDIVHADIKIDNIFMTQNRVMLGDFGMAQTVRVCFFSVNCSSEKSGLFVRKIGLFAAVG